MNDRRKSLNSCLKEFFACLWSITENVLENILFDVIANNKNKSELSKHS